MVSVMDGPPGAAGIEAPDEGDAERPAEQLHEHEHRRPTTGAMPAKVSENIRADRDGRVGEAGRAGEPVGGGDVAADGVGHRLGPAAPQAAEDDQHQAEGRHDLAQPQSAAGALVRGDARPRRGRTSGWPAPRRRCRRPPGRRPAAPASRCRPGPSDPLDQGHHRVERGRDRLQGEDQCDQDGAGGEAVLEQLEADVVGREPGGGDAGADDGHRPGTRCRRSSATARRRERGSRGDAAEQRGEVGQRLAAHAVVDPDAALAPVEQADLVQHLEVVADRGLARGRTRR